METPEITSHEPNEEPALLLTSEAQYFLYTAGRWAYFIGIVGFVITGLVLLLSLFVGTIFTTISQLQPQAFPIAGMGGLLSFIYILFAAFYFFFSLYIYQFGSSIKKGISFNDTAQVTIATGKLKSFFKLWGISTIVIISLYALMFAGGIIFAIAGFAKH